jgi:NADH-quinone oxidoreductase subunit I
MDDPAPGQKAGKDWCTSCGICAKVCPPQCIWIERGKLPNGRPKPEPVNFYIDIDICMNCGYCAEYCPFDAIKMDHDYELASFDRTTLHIHDKARLTKPNSYWIKIAPTRAAEEAEERGGWEHKDVIKEYKKTGGPEQREPKAEVSEVAEPVAEAPVATATDAEPAQAEATESTGPDLGDEEKRRQRREAALARKAARATKRDQGDS